LLVPNYGNIDAFPAAGASSMQEGPNDFADTMISVRDNSFLNET